MTDSSKLTNVKDLDLFSKHDRKLNFEQLENIKDPILLSELKSYYRYTNNSMQCTNIKDPVLLSKLYFNDSDDSDDESAEKNDSFELSPSIADEHSLNSPLVVSITAIILYIIFHID